MSLLKKLFGGGGGNGSAPTAEPVIYEGFRITPAPQAEGRQYRLAAKVEKEIGGETKTHHLIRADLLDSAEAASDAAVAKAKMMIDQMGDRLFGD